MKRTGISRGKSTLRRTPLRGGKVALRRTRLNRVGKRKKREADALAKFRTKLEGQGCSNCRKGPELNHVDGVFWGGPPIDPHHLVPRSIAAGHPNTHHIGNRAWLCRKCHSAAHEGKLPHLILKRSHLDSLT